MQQSLLDDSHIRTPQDSIISQELLKKYIIYAKKYVRPKLDATEFSSDRLTDFYADIRKYSQIIGGIPIGVRHMESVIRMAEASARMRLSEHVISSDFTLAIKMMLESFLQSQKFSVARTLRSKFFKYLNRDEDYNQVLKHILRKMAKDKVKIPQLIVALG